MEKVKIILEAGANPNQESGSKLRILPLESAIHIPFKIHAYEKGSYDVLVDVIKSGIDNNYCIANFAKSCDAVTQEDLDLLKIQNKSGLQDCFTRCGRLCVKNRGFAG